MAPMVRWFLVILVVLALGGLAFWARGGKEETPHAASTPQRPPVSVELVTLAAREVPETLEISGTVVPLRRATLSTRLSGRITRLVVEEGDRVHAGETLVVVDASDIEARVSQAEAGTVAAAAGTRQAEAARSTASAAVTEARSRIASLEAQRAEALSRLNLAQTEHKRQDFLFREGAVPRQKADQTLSELEVAQARLRGLDAGLAEARAAVRRAEAMVGETDAAVAGSHAAAGQAAAEVAVAGSNLSYSQVLAPFDGVVIRKLAWQGEMAAPGAPLLEIQDVRQVRLEAAVPEDQLARLHLNGTVPVHLDALNRQVRGTVKQIVPSGDAGSRTFTVKIALENADGRIVPGMYGRVRLSQGQRSLLTVPATAVVRRGQLESVYVVDDKDVARLRMVKVGEERDGEVEVLSGLKAGERVVRVPGSLADGDRVASR